MPKKAPSKNAQAHAAHGKKGKEPSQPDILVAYTPAGRETMDAIQSELVPMPLAAVTELETSSPEITIRESIAGRDTLAAIFEEARPAARAPQTTLRYGDRVSNAPGARTPSSAPGSKKPSAAPGARTPSSAPSGKKPSTAPSSKAAPEAGKGVEIFEMMTYVVRGAEAARLSSEPLRRSFVEQHLLARLPTKSMDDIDRVDVTPWTVQGTLVVRVWCRLPAATRG